MFDLPFIQHARTFHRDRVLLFNVITMEPTSDYMSSSDGHETVLDNLYIIRGTYHQ